MQAVKLAKEIGGSKAAKELGVPEGTIHTWLKTARCGALDMGEGSPYAKQCNEPDGVDVPSERTVYRVMEAVGLSHRPKRKPNGITKADREAHKSEDLLKRDFRSGKPLKKSVTDITETKAKNGKLYVSAIFDCFDSGVLGLAMDTNMKATLCTHTIENACLAYPSLRGTILHSDRGSQYTSEPYRQALSMHGIIQSMNSAGG